jgi:hypothetical protein
LRWTLIKALLHNQVIKISYLVVIVLPILIEIFEVFKLTPPIAASVYEIFYSGLLLLVLILLYNVFGPAEITHYDDIHDYVNKNTADLLVAFPDMKKQIVMAHLDNAQSETRSKITALDKQVREELNTVDRNNLELSLEVLLNPLYPGCVNRYLQKKWDIANRRKNWLILLLCLIIAATAIILAIGVFYFRVITVINYKSH